MSESPIAAVRAKLKELVGKGLDQAVAELETSLAWLWERDAAGELAPDAIPTLANAYYQHLKRIAPPPPKKVKLDAPLRKILPLAETNARAALDVLLLLEALVQIGDFTEQTDKERQAFRLFLDDWRRMIFESAKIADFEKFRALVGREDRVVGPHRFSRTAAIDVLEGLFLRRTDKFAGVPDVSMIACDRCGGFRSRERLRCHQCKGLYCTKCFSPERDVCLKDFATRYRGLDAEMRKKIGKAAADLCRKHRFDPHIRIDTFVKPLKEMGIDVVFQEAGEGQETEVKGRRRLTLRHRESSGARRILFAALYRAYIREATQPPPPSEDDPEALPKPPPFDASAIADPLFQDYFVDVCMGLPIEDALHA